MASTTLMDFFNRLVGRRNKARQSVSAKPNDHFFTHDDFSVFEIFLNNILPDPDEVLTKAGLNSGAYRDLLTDGHVKGSVVQRKSRVKRMKIVILSGDPKDSKANAARDMVEAQFKKIQRIPEVVNEILDAPLFGATYLEMFWNRLPISSDRPNGVIELTNLMAKPYEWFAYTPQNELVAKTDDSILVSDTIEIPPNKIFPVVKDGTYKNPYGDRAFKAAFWPYQFKKGGLRFWTEFLEKYGMPFLFGRLEAKKSIDDLTTFHNDLVDMVRNGVVVSKSDGKEQIDVIESKSRGASSDAYKTYKNAMNIEISKAILGETLTIENSESGSQAATETHLIVLESIQDEDTGMVERAFEGISRMITNFNFGVDTLSPIFVLVDPKELSLKQAERDAVLSDKIGVKFKKQYIAKTYKIEEDDFDMGAPVKPGTPTPGSTRNGEPRPEPREAPEGGEPEFAEGFPVANGVDKFIDGSVERMEFLSDDLKAKLKNIVRESEDYADLTVRLTSLKDAVDSTTFSQMYSQSLDIAYIVGQWAVNENKI